MAVYKDNGKGYEVTANFTNLVHINTTTGDPDSGGEDIAYSTNTPSAENLGVWTAEKSNGDKLVNGEVAFSTSTMDPAAGTTYSITYKVSLHNNQAKGTYKGTATYTLAQKAN